MAGAGALGVRSRRVVVAVSACEANRIFTVLGSVEFAGVVAIESEGHPLHFVFGGRPAVVGVGGWVTM